MANSVLSPQEEAVSILEKILLEFSSPSMNLENILRSCQHVCQILGWTEQLHWFYKELNGYSLHEVPQYRNG